VEPAVVLKESNALLDNVKGEEQADYSPAEPPKNIHLLDGNGDERDTEFERY
jgi:hypothetical protein